MSICSVDGCERRHRVRGLCDTHYAYWRRTGKIGQLRVKTLAERLWSKVDKTEGQGPNGDCWEWRGYVHPTGYGQLMAGDGSQKNINSNRAAWIAENGDIPDGLWVLHRCDNRLCCNPEHLWLGTPRDNTQDMIAKGRRRSADQVARGEDVGNAKITEEIVRAIRAEPPMTFKALGEKYGISTATAHSIKLRRTWTHID